MHNKNFKLAVVASFTLLSACGTHTPDFQEFWGSPSDAQDRMVQIINQVKCELTLSLQNAELNDIDEAKNRGDHRRNLAWLNKWGIDADFIFTIEEKSIINPGISLNVPVANNVKNFGSGTSLTTSQSYASGLGGAYTSDAYRQEKVHVFYKVSDLVGPEPTLNRNNINGFIANKQCLIRENPEKATLFGVSDLKINDFIDEIKKLESVQEAKFESPDSFASQGVLSNELRFEIVSTGTVNPAWKLVRVSANSNSTLFSTTRDRTQDLIITMGPLVETKTTDKSGKVIININFTNKAQNSALAAEIGAAVANAINR